MPPRPIGLTSMPELPMWRGFSLPKFAVAGGGIRFGNQKCRKRSRNILPVIGGVLV